MTRPEFSDARGLPSSRESQIAGSPKERSAEVDVGHCAVDDLWFHDQYGLRTGEKVETKQFVDANGWTRITIRSKGSQSGAKITFAFRRRDGAAPEALVSGTWHEDRVIPGQPSSGAFTDLEARVLVSRVEWGKGWPMKCVFIASAHAKDTPYVFAGGFVVDAE